MAPSSENATLLHQLCCEMQAPPAGALLRLGLFAQASRRSVHLLFALNSLVLVSAALQEAG